MSGSDNDPPEDPKTIFAPFTSPGTSVPGHGESQPPVSAAPPPPSFSPPPPPPAPPPAPSPTGEKPRDGQLRVGDVLNHIYEVRRFIARGGMGEVYEGVNVNNPDEKVAIKVILPALVADPNVQAMFRKEATTLTRVSHPAVVSYRLLGQDPQLGILYIVTEYIEGTNLSDVLAKVPNDAQSLTGLIRQLADGLRVAHSLGAVHRDISPDNVILAGGNINQPRLIDFGIAKDLDPGKATIVGDGFAGKLTFVAPEQLGDFGRDVGPWSDVYSLGLVILAVANRRNVDMGATLVDAVDRRRQGVDVSGAPSSLQGVLAGMVQADPQKRLRSMADVLDALDRIGSGAGPAPTPPPVAAKAEKPAREMPAWAAKAIAFAKARPLPFAGGAIGALLLLGTIWGFSGGDDKPQEAAVAAASVPPQDRAQQALGAVLPGLDCTWLDVQQMQVEGDKVTIAFKGVAGNGAAAQKAISDALVAAKLDVSAISFENVMPAPQSVCTLLDAYRPIKSQRGGDISSDQPQFERTAQAEMNGAVVAIPQIRLSAEVMSGNLVLGGIDPDAAATAGVFAKSIEEVHAQLGPGMGTREPDGSVTLKVEQGNDGLVGLLVIFGKSQIPADQVMPSLTSRTPQWRDAFLANAKREGWQADMVWFRIVNQEPDTAPAAAPATLGQPTAGPAAAPAPVAKPTAVPAG
ncbi:serine/threonine-protein kinase [Novosphingobium sp.]|uniref:serine/threonine-protein kinase n=1 Tax=Novosphingobium sp. TaxID=1874826 RepID=UPI00286DE95A|nr:serine/threonine-protein kinase [Novosphingobium sp.]